MNSNNRAHKKLKTSVFQVPNRSFGIKKERLKLTDSEIINNFAPRKIVIITEQEHNRYPTDYQWV